MRFAIALLLALFAAAPASAQTYPTRPVRVIVPFPAGGVTDVGARMVAQKLGEALGQPMVIENRAGASGTLGVDAVTKSPPDGYTMLMTTGDFTTVPSLMPKTAYDPLQGSDRRHPLRHRAAAAAHPSGERRRLGARS